MSMGVSGLTYQVVRCFQSIERFGESRHLAKKAGTADDGVHSITTMKHYVSYSVAFTKWAKKRYGIRLLREIRESMGAEYLDALAKEGKTARTIKTITSALRKLERGFEACFGGQIKVLPDDFEAPRSGLDMRVRAHIYTEEEVRLIFEELQGEIALVIAVQILAGLRLSEALSLRPSMVDLRSGFVTVKGKGGKVRSVPLDRPAAREFFEKLVEGISEKEKIFTVSAATVQRRVRMACLKYGIDPGGTHGFRRHYACLTLRDLLLKGFDVQSAKRAVSKKLGHNRLNVVSHYIPRPR